MNFKIAVINLLYQPLYKNIVCICISSDGCNYIIYWGFELGAYVFPCDCHLERESVLFYWYKI